MFYYAHTKNLPGTKTPLPEHTWELVKDHLLKVADRAQGFALKFGYGPCGYLLGLIHDVGKYTAAFQKRLRGGPIVDHSTAGAQILYNRYSGKGFRVTQNSVMPSATTGFHNNDRFLLALLNCAAGHHTGLMSHLDGECSLLKRLHNKFVKNPLPALDFNFPEQVEAYLKKCDQIPIPHCDISFFTRFLFSCLIDADRLEAEKFGNLEKFNSRPTETLDCDLLLAKLQNHRNDPVPKVLSTCDITEDANDLALKVQEMRTEVLDACRQKFKEPPGFFSLTVPTGGGKTLSSLEFALLHAKKHSKERIIYAVPFITVTEQIAKTFKEIFGSAVLEHHSNIYKEDIDKGEPHRDLELATENWDSPIVVTTNVQFFQSLFSHRGSSCRKLHNIVNSVIILDEAQTIPNDFIAPCLAVLKELVKNYKCTIVLCTATQPALKKKSDFTNGLDPVTDIISDPSPLYQKIIRTKIEHLPICNIEYLAAHFGKNERALCIVNTRQIAQTLYKLVSKEYTDVYHLSTYMCGIERDRVLNEIKKRLKEKLPCRVISTSLIEAGVDIDFPVVYRELNGVDSIVQAAGRCNREGSLPTATVYVFELQHPFSNPSYYQDSTQILITKDLKGNNLLDLDTIDEYFRRLIRAESVKANWDKKAIIESQDNQRYRKVSEDFQFIEDERSIAIPFDQKARDYIDAFRLKPLRDLQRRLQPYMVSVSENNFHKLLNSKQIESIDSKEESSNGLAVLSDLQLYDPDLGLVIPTN